MSLYKNNLKPKVKLNKIAGFYTVPTSDHLRMQDILSRWYKILGRLDYDPYTFPTVGCNSDLQKEKTHFKIASEVYDLGEGTYLAPTGQMIMYPLVLNDKNLVNFKWYQTKSVYRKEAQTNKYLLRHKEILYFHELHACFSSEEAQKREFKKLLRIFSKFLKSEGLNFRVHERLGDQVFPGARRTIAFDTVLKDGKALQIGTLHDLGDNFSKVLGGPKVYQICLGFTQRVLGALKDHYGSNLKDWKNPCKVLKVSKNKNQTIRTICENLEEHYQNKYTNVKGKESYHHVLSKETLVKNQLKKHDKFTEKLVNLEAQNLIKPLLSKYFFSNINGKYFLGIDIFTKQRIYAEQKV